MQEEMISIDHSLLHVPVRKQCSQKSMSIKQYNTGIHLLNLYVGSNIYAGFDLVF